MMYFNRDVWKYSQLKKERNWAPYYLHGLSGQKLVIIGYGDIGQRCAKAARHFNMEVYGVRRTVTNDMDENGVHICSQDQLDQLLPKANFVLSVLPGTKETKHMFDKNFFVKMNPQAIFINIGRGVTQVDEDIVDAINKGVIRGAGLDVAEQEPLPANSPL
uniref:Putative 2-ketogluconate reductase n=1 Tax=Lygus hesperus TaxID=30085 RepID=A0A0A9Z8G9_LYGHE